MDRLFLRFGNPPCRHPYGPLKVCSNLKTEPFFDHTTAADLDRGLSDCDQIDALNMTNTALRELLMGAVFGVPSCLVGPTGAEYGQHQQPDAVFKWANQVLKDFAADQHWRSVFPFRDRHGYVAMYAVKMLMETGDGQSVKTLTPYTRWRQRGTPHTFYFRTPLPHGQILFALDRLAGLEGNSDHVVLLTDSVEIADLNQRHPNSGMTWTSWLGGAGALPYVDWSPLEGRTVVLVTTNHSGKRLEDAYINQEKVAKHLTELDIGIKLEYVEIAVEHRLGPDVRFGDDLGRYLNAVQAKANRPQVKGVNMLSRTEFEQRVQEAEAVIACRENGLAPFAGATQATEPELLHEPQDEIEYAILPDIRLGAVNLIDALEGYGKTSFLLSQCGSIISGKQVIEGCCRPVPKHVSAASRVLYLNFEGIVHNNSNRNSDIESKRRLCFEPYVTKKDRDRLHIVNNIPRPLTAKTIHLVIDEFEKFKRAYPEAIHIVALDHLTGILGQREQTGDWENIILPLLEALLQRGATIIIVDHAKEGGKTQGHKEKLGFVNSSYGIRPLPGTKKSRSLESPRMLVPSKTRSHGIERLMEDVKIFRDPKTGRWCRCDTEGKGRPSKEFLLEQEALDFCAIVKYYQQNPDLDNDDIASLTGYGRSQFYVECNKHGLTKKTK
jgi:hypothetical protein